MVHYAFTPWRDRQELLRVRSQFYDDHGEEQQDAAAAAAARRVEQHRAVARVSLWVHRGNCPHMVESTALLMAAVLSDEAAPREDASSSSSSASEYAIRAAYSAAFSRFVTGLLDGHQDKQRKQSMYSVAKTIGLPATFVELRHQSTHEQLPSLPKLRAAAKRALAWIWDYYWQHLGDDGGSDDVDADQGPPRSKTERMPDPCKAAVLAYILENDEGRQKRTLASLHRWDRQRVLRAIAELQDTLPGNQVYLKFLKLSIELIDATEPLEKRGRGVGGSQDVDAKVLRADKRIRVEGGEGEEEGEEEEASAPTPAPPEEEEDDDNVNDNVNDNDVDVEGTLHSDCAPGWSRPPGQWVPKPIGIV